MVSLELTAEQIVNQLKKSREDLKKMSPEYYAELVKATSILTPGKQRPLARLDESGFLYFLMNRGSSACLNIYPEHVSPVIRKFSDEASYILNAMPRVRFENLPEIRKHLGRRSKLIALADGRKLGEDSFGQLYTVVPREEGDSYVMTNKIEYHATGDRIPGQFFLATTGGVCLRFYDEEVGLIAPRQANAYLIGTPIVATVHEGKLYSPIIAGARKPTGVNNGEYHIIPIEFFSVRVDKSEKFAAVDLHGLDASGNPNSLSTVVKRRELEEICA